LYGECRDLYLLANFEWGKERLRIRGVRAKEKNSGGDMEEEEVEDNHSQNPSYSPSINEQMESGVEDHGLPSNHSVPANNHEGGTDVVVAAKIEKLQQEPNRMHRYAPRSNKKAPKVKSCTSPKGGEDPKLDLKDIENCNGEEGSDNHRNRKRKIFYSTAVALTRETVRHNFLCALPTSVHVEKYSLIESVSGGAEGRFRSSKGNDPWTRETGKPFRHLILIYD